jgi:hypothetical protein
MLLLYGELFVFVCSRWRISFYFLVYIRIVSVRNLRVSIYSVFFTIFYSLIRLEATRATRHMTCATVKQPLQTQQIPVHMGVTIRGLMQHNGQLISVKGWDRSVPPTSFAPPLPPSPPPPPRSIKEMLFILCNVRICKATQCTVTTGWLRTVYTLNSYCCSSYCTSSLLNVRYIVHPFFLMSVILYIHSYYCWLYCTSILLDVGCIVHKFLLLLVILYIHSSYCWLYCTSTLLTVGYIVHPLFLLLVILYIHSSYCWLYCTSTLLIVGYIVHPF